LGAGAYRTSGGQPPPGRQLSFSRFGPLPAVGKIQFETRWGVIGPGLTKRKKGKKRKESVRGVPRRKKRRKKRHLFRKFARVCQTKNALSPVRKKKKRIPRTLFVRSFGNGGCGSGLHLLRRHLDWWPRIRVGGVGRETRWGERRGEGGRGAETPMTANGAPGKSRYSLVFREWEWRERQAGRVEGGGA